MPRGAPSEPAVTAFTVVGDALLDVLAQPAEPMRPGADVRGSVALAPGGQGANLAVRLARRGADVELVCALADDAAGRMIRAALVAEGIRLGAIPVDASGAVLVLLDGGGERSMLSQRVPFADAVAVGPRLGGDWLVISGHILLEAGAAAAIEAVAAEVPHRAVIGCAVPDAALEAWRAAVELLRPDLLVLNAEESGRLPGLARDRLVVVTDAGGATARLGGQRVRVQAPPGPPPIDTTGAGDAFAATLLVELAGSWPPHEDGMARALAAAAAVAADVTRVAGAQGRLRTEGDATLAR